MEKRFQETVRYLGYGRNAVDERTHELIEKGFEDLEKAAKFRFVSRIFELERIDDENVRIGTLSVKSKSLARNLNQCEKIVLFGATLP